MMKNIKKEIAELRKEIIKHDRLYYGKAASEISDQEYDKLFARLKQIEADYPELIIPESPTQRVSETLTEGFRKVHHTVPMLSIDNTYNADELREFDQRVVKALENPSYKYTVELKIDGVAMSLRYEKGKLIQAATRGKGMVGDDVTDNVREISDIPSVLTSNITPDVLEVRGEVYMLKSTFNDINTHRKNNSEALLANPRNATAGALKLLDSSQVAERKLSFFAYSIGQISKSLGDSHYDCLKKLNDFGFPVNPNIQRASNIDVVIEICNKWQEQKYELDYQIDGMVIKVDSYHQQKFLGSTGRAPCWCISYKFPAEQAETILNKITVQVGKTGVLTPVANLEPVKLSGSVVKRASLHNFNEVARLDVRYGDTVVIEKAGEIIPQIIKVKHEKRDISKGVPFKVPDRCCVCNGEIEKDEDGVRIRCINPNCKAKFIEKLKYFVGRNQMNIENLGPAILEQLVEKGLVKSFTDIYKLGIKQNLFDEDENTIYLSQLDGLGDKSASNIIDSIEKSKTNLLWRFVAALGIKNVGGQSAEILAEEFGSLEAIIRTDIETLEAIDQIGSTLAKSIYGYFRDKDNVRVIDELLVAGVRPTCPTKKKKSTALAGKTIVATGTLEKFTRQSIAQTIKDNGGKVSSSVSKKTDFLLAGTNAGSKLEKANKLGVRVITEAEFLDMIGAAND